MTKAAQAVRDEALALAPVDRADLIEELIASFDPRNRSVIDRAWAQESEDRIAAYERGELKSTPLEHVVQRANQR